MARAVNFTEATYLALHAMTLLAGEEGGSLLIHTMASRLGVSQAHLAKVVQRLASCGLVRTARGPRGGVALAKSPGEINYLEIFEAIEGRMQPVGCVFGKEHCSLPRCIFRDFLAKMTVETEKWLKSNTLADFAAAKINGG